MKPLSRDEIKTWISSSVLPLHTRKFDLCHQGGLWNHVAAHQSVTELSPHTNATAMHSLSSVTEREKKREGESKNVMRENLPSEKNKYIGKTELCWHLVNILSREKNKVKHNFQAHKGPPWLHFYAGIYHLSIDCCKNTSLLTTHQLGKRYDWLTVWVCIPFIHHIHYIISLVIACVLVVLQVMTVGSGQGDKWLSPSRQTSCLDRQWRKGPLHRLRLRCSPYFSLFCLPLSIHLPICPSIHPSIQRSPR